MNPIARTLVGVGGATARIIDRVAAAYKSWSATYLFGFPRVPWDQPITPLYGNDTELSIAAYWAAIRVLSEDMASLPLFIYHRLDKGREKAPEHPLYETLHDFANPEMTSFQWRETSMGHLLSWGNCYSEMVYDRAYRLQLYPLRPDRVEVEWDSQGRRAYYYNDPRKGRRELDRDLMFHVAGLSWDGLKGYSPVSLARRTLSIARRAETFADSFYLNGARPGTVLTTPPGYPEIAKANLKTAWKDAHSVAAGKAGGVALLEDGVTASTMTMPLDDAQFLETRKFQVTEIARWFRLPPHMLADLDRSTNNNIEHQGLEYVIHSLRPWLVRWEQAIKLQLMRDEPDYYAEFQMDALLRGDAVSRAQALNIQHRSGVLLTDEWRAMENRNPLPDGLGEAPLVAADTVALAPLLAPPPAPAVVPDPLALPEMQPVPPATNGHAKEAVPA